MRLLQSAGNISTSRITAFLEIILKPISTDFCKNCPDEFCQDSRRYIGDLLNWEERLNKTEKTGKQKQVFRIVAADVKALYPSLCRDTETKALECALRKHSNFNQCAKNHCQAEINLPKQCCHPIWRPVIYQKNGIVTGGNHSVSLANIAVDYILQPIAGVVREAALFSRFIDDIIWIATSKLSNENIRQARTSAFANSGLELTFRQACTADQKGEVGFLDVDHCITTDKDFGFVTKDFVKPTTEGRQFTNGKSRHPHSTFKSILLGESTRLRRLNQRKEDYLSSLI